MIFSVEGDGLSAGYELRRMRERDVERTRWVLLSGRRVRHGD